MKEMILLADGTRGGDWRGFCCIQRVKTVSAQKSYKTQIEKALKTK